MPLRLLVWMDSLAQLTGDLWQFSPSVFVRSRAAGPTRAHRQKRHLPLPGLRAGPPARYAPAADLPGLRQDLPGRERHLRSAGAVRIPE